MLKTIHCLPRTLRIKPKLLTLGFMVLPDMVSPYPRSRDCCEGHVSVHVSAGPSRGKSAHQGSTEGALGQQT